MTHFMAFAGAASAVAVATMSAFCTPKLDPIRVGIGGRLRLGPRGHEHADVDRERGGGEKRHEAHADVDKRHSAFVASKMSKAREHDSALRGIRPYCFSCFSFSFTVPPFLATS